MNWQRFLAPVLGVVLLAAAWHSYGWAGVALVVTGLVMWALLHFNRIANVLQKAAERPKGYVGSAVMLNAKLKPRVNLLHVVAITQSLGERLSPEGEDPEIYRWTDGTDSHVTCEFVKGRLATWTLYRPTDPADAPHRPPLKIARPGTKPASIPKDTR